MKNRKLILSASALIGALFANEGCNRTPPTPPVTGIGSIEYVSQHPFGEIPYGRNLIVGRYSINQLKDIHTLKVDEPIATIEARFSREYPNTTADRSSDSINYTIHVVGESENDANRVANNLSKYNIVMVTPPFDDGRGLRTDAVRVIPTENGLVYQIPASSLKFSRLEVYDIKGERKNTVRGSIEADGVHRPWLTGSQSIEAPCTPEDPYKSPCAVPEKSAPASSPATKKPTPAPKPKSGS